MKYFVTTKVKTYEISTLICAKTFPFELLPYSMVVDIGYSVDILLSLMASGGCPLCIIVG